MGFARRFERIDAPWLCMYNPYAPGVTARAFGRETQPGGTRPKRKAVTCSYQLPDKSAKSWDGKNWILSW